MLRLFKDKKKTFKEGKKEARAEGSIQHLEAGVPGRRWANPQSRGPLGREGWGAGKGRHRPSHPVLGRTPSRHHRSGQRARVAKAKPYEQ